MIQARPLVVVRLRRPLSSWCCCCQGTTTNFFHAFHRYSWDVLLKENWWRGKQDQHHHFSQLRTPNSKKELFPPLSPLGDEIVSANMVANFLSLFTIFEGFWIRISSKKFGYIQNHTSFHFEKTIITITFAPWIFDQPIWNSTFSSPANCQNSMIKIIWGNTGKIISWNSNSIQLYYLLVI